MLRLIQADWYASVKIELSESRRLLVSLFLSLSICSIEPATVGKGRRASIEEIVGPGGRNPPAPRGPQKDNVK